MNENEDLPRRFWTACTTSGEGFRCTGSSYAASLFDRFVVNVNGVDAVAVVVHIGPGYEWDAMDEGSFIGSHRLPVEEQQ